MNKKPIGKSRLKSLHLLLLAVLPAATIHAESPHAAPTTAFPWTTKAEEKNLLVNGNFEHGLDHWELIAFSKHGKMSIDTEELHDGKPTLRIDNVEGDHSFVRQILKGKSSKARYRLSGYIKTKDVEPVKPGRDGAVLMLGMSLDMTSSIQKTTPWTKVTFDFTPSPKTPNEIRVGPSLGVYARPVTGTAWFADLTLTELGPTGKK
ncbi:MAG: carbohydrate binding domain-containing protein [Chthoniobacter sp.]|uniref:carbohydrate binding domain-containing protein n=1 Tax=Chthoniobacter sp. TaxID=2510640 RepID=UPI0032A5EC26